MLNKVEFNKNLLSQTPEYKALQSLSVTKENLKLVLKKLREFINDGFLTGNIEIANIIESIKKIDKNGDIDFFKQKYILGLKNKDYSIVDYMIRDLKRKDLWQYFDIEECLEIEQIAKYSKAKRYSEKSWE